MAEATLKPSARTRTFAVKRFAVLRNHLRGLQECQSGLSMIEFALILPVLMTLGIFGTEVAAMASARMQVSEIALSVGDNASRLGQTQNSGVTPTITELDIDSVMTGAIKQGDQIKFSQFGKIILTSLEKDTATGKQFIKWQRCRGSLTATSAYGNATTNNGLVGAPLAGMGNAGYLITAPTGSAVMFVEVYYNYQSLFGSLFVTSQSFKQEAAFIIRDRRNLTPGITGTGGSSACT